MATHVDHDALLRLLVRERFPAWKAVLNEDAAVRLAAGERYRRRRLLDRALGPDVPDQLSVARRKREIDERQRIVNEALEPLPVDSSRAAGE